MSKCVSYNAGSLCCQHNLVQLSYVSALMKEFKAQKLLGYIHSGKDGVHTSEPSLCFHTVPINKNLFQKFGKQFMVSTDTRRRPRAVTLYLYMFSL